MSPTLETARAPLDPGIPDAVVEQACAAYWWHDSPGVSTWDDLVKRGDHRIPMWREKMRAALTAIWSEIQPEDEIVRQSRASRFRARLGRPK